MSGLGHAKHLFRFAGIFAAGFLIVFAARIFLVPQSFGQFGHYRGKAIQEIASRPVRYAGHQSCETCHADVLEKKSAGRHAHVNCEACHGPLAKHAEDPASVSPGKPDTAILCVRCHAASTARPKHFPQISSDHSGGLSCDTCHQPHNPAVQTGGGK